MDDYGWLIFSNFGLLSNHTHANLLLDVSTATTGYCTHSSALALYTPARTQNAHTQNHFGLSVCSGQRCSQGVYNCRAQGI